VDYANVPLGLIFLSHPFFSAGEYDLKDIVAFHAEDMDLVAEECGLYFHEVRSFFVLSFLFVFPSAKDINYLPPFILQEPKDQLMDPTFWADEAKLNQLRRQGVRFARIRLQAGDVYCIPRRVVHQFQTVSGCISVTWHLKYGKYYTDAAKEEESKGTPTTGEHSF